MLTGYSATNSARTTYTAYTLDTMGNPTAITTSTNSPQDTPVTKTLTWGEGRMLTGITTDANNYVYYTYNADGLRIKKTVCKNGLETETDYIWSDGKLVAERSGLSSTIILYDSDNSPVGFIRQGITGTNTVQYSYLKNLQGDITHILDENGETVVSYIYDPWGNPTVQGNTSIAAINPCSYRGYYYDEETGWYYLQSRYYDPEIGRFLNADEVLLLGATNELNGFNQFLYCNNQPITAYDENGAATINIVFAAVGSVVGWFLGDYVAKQLGYYSGLKYWAIRTGIIVGGAVIGWFAGTLLTRILANFLRSRPDIVFKLVAAKGGATVYTVLQFLGINPFTLYQNGSTFIGILRAFNNSKVTLTYDWAVKLYYKARQLGYGVELHAPEKGYSWHLHITNNGKKYDYLHVQIVKSAWDYLKRIIR